MEITEDLGTCPTGQHLSDFRQCGFAGCVDLRPWARANRYRSRLEESYKAENDAHVKGDGRWFVEILCQRGLIYPKGGNEVLAVTTSTDAWRSLIEIGCKPRRVGDKERECMFPVELLDKVAAILRPRMRKTISPEHLKALQEGLKASSESGKIDQQRMQSQN